MKLEFRGECDELLPGISELSGNLSYKIAENADFIVFVKKQNDGLKVIKNDKKIEIFYEEKIHFFRALGLLMEKINEDSFEINEKPHFKTVGIMLDASRGQVPNVKNIKMFLSYMAVMGMNLMMLYTEETYEIESEPYFGYMRGRYSKDELKECDLYARKFGIEMVPCIQTLGHMEQFLKWPDALKYADTDKVLLADDEKTYEFIEKAIVAASEPFSSKRIHIGMDEANDFGLGRYLNKNGYTNRLEIMNRHLQRVSKIAQKHSLKPMIWSDMYMHISELDSSADESSAEKAIAQISPDTQFVLWDYYREDKNRYVEKIRKHKRMGRIPVFAGGIWCWTSFGADYDKTFKTTAPALAACKEENVTEVIATIWANSAETSLPSALMGLSYFAENTYMPEFDMERFKERIEFCTGIPFDEFYSLTKLYKIEGQFNQEEEPPNPSSSLLWQDVLMGLYDGEMKDIQTEGHYKACAEEFEEFSVGSYLRDIIFTIPAQLCRVLSVKSEIGLKLKKAYDEKNTGVLGKLNTDLIWLKDALETLRKEHRRVYFECNKPLGFDLLDVRYGGVIMRVDTAISRINDYLKGKIDRIEELEQERLPFDPTGDYFLHWRKYSHISIPHTTKYSMG